MQTFADIMNRIARSEDFELRDLETIVGNEIALKSGATRGIVAGAPALAVQRIPLGATTTGHEIGSAINWIARRVREGGSGLFNVAVRRQPTNLIVVAEWPRSAKPQPGAPLQRTR